MFFRILQVVENMERETGIGPATNSLEGCDSTIELLPLEWGNHKAIISRLHQTVDIAFARISTASSTCCSVTIYGGRKRSTVS